MDPIVKNLWLSLTIVLPGMVTYGMWRLMIIFIGYTALDFSAIDNSMILSLSVLFAIALIQQAIGISIEALLTGFFYLCRKRWKYVFLLFVERFSRLTKNSYNEDVKRTIGQFFLSLNLAVGQILILFFLIVAENPPGVTAVTKPDWMYSGLVVLIMVTSSVAVFRCWNAIKVIRTLEDTTN